MKSIITTIVCLITVLVILNIFCLIKIEKIENEIELLKKPGSFFSSREELISFIESKISSLWEFISLQQKQIELNAEKLKKK